MFVLLSVCGFFFFVSIASDPEASFVWPFSLLCLEKFDFYYLLRVSFVPLFCLLGFCFFAKFLICDLLLISSGAEIKLEVKKKDMRLKTRWTNRAVWKKTFRGRKKEQPHAKET